MTVRDETTAGKANPGLRAMVALVITVALFGALAWVAPTGAYDWVKALHVIAIISWMAGMLYLPRLFVNHCGVAVGSPESQLLKGMERRLLRIIVNPAMTLAWVSGIWIAWNGAWLKSGWFHGKLLLVLLLSGAHGYFSAAVRKFAEDRNTVSERHWRMINEIPAVLMIGIVILVVVKPF
ncbi:protoporphyrinogen oxidase HemJ [Prosthecomicrobium sp. N25]|uniref:protoporphyrinogen oxidase HemJ n=1 Tax=Prosthecomicrobium sp. N25 TaxID=3129254 RepID=UPI00307894F0